ncbi:histidine phosphatase family protein [Planomonospora sp. ID82291]|nr:histidine phosphatase family protein [Planomonospora sp. ID82291]
MGGLGHPGAPEVPDGGRSGTAGPHVPDGPDGPVDPPGVRGPAALRAPERRCLQTAEALGLRAGPDPLLADWDHGRWRGMTLAEVEAAEPAELAAWLTDPAAAPHGGESVLDLLGRVSGWLSAVAPGRTVAVTHPAVVRAAVVHALDAPARSFWRVDAAPLTRVALTGRGGRWRLRLPA